LKPAKEELRIMRIFGHAFEKSCHNLIAYNVRLYPCQKGGGASS